MSKLFSFIGCLLVIVGGIFMYLPLNALFSRSDWLSLSYGPAILGLLPVLVTLFIVVNCLILIGISAEYD
jgi:hypothetical protein